MAKVKNPRFPHYCKIYTLKGETSFADAEEVVLYEGVCNKYGSTSLRTFKTNGVIRSEYAVDMPGLVGGITQGALIDVTDFAGTITKAIISESYPTSLGTTAYFDIERN